MEWKYIPRYEAFLSPVMVAPAVQAYRNHRQEERHKSEVRLVDGVSSRPPRDTQQTK